MAAAAALQSQGYRLLQELAGGYRACDLQYHPVGRRRAKGAFRDKAPGWDLAVKLLRLKNKLNRGRLSCSQALRHPFLLLPA
ncbi:hypothetical protein D9Q98_010261 [Chlorella vulgaris]|uniref:Uncharacterized protein n=1 Tax=Chlorella vulgaris TaxID=3077 RepID=A0A9D4TJV2_CHLVU|nr:hypothetical protein D9Q98_010261 [Chlorella vulgaris]